MYHTHVLLLITLLFVFITPSVLAQSQGFSVIDEGTAQVHLILPELPNSAEKLAASILQEYIKRATGVELAIVHEPVSPETSGIFIGNTRSSSVVDEYLGQLTLADGFVIQVSPTGIIIKGRTNAGVVFAAFHFLETFVGCRWYGPGELWEVVPKTTNLVVPETLVVEEPDFQLRIMANISKDAVKDGRFLLANKINVGYQDVQLAQAAGLGPFITAGVFGHNLDQLLPNSYFATNPEYFALIDGQRRPTGPNVQAAIHVPEVAEIVANNVRLWIEQAPISGLYWVAPNDGPAGWSEDEESLRLHQELDKGRTWTFEGVGTKQVVTDRWLLFLNRVSDAIAAEYPNHYLLTFAYNSTIFPPVTMRNNANIIPFIAPYRPGDYTYTLNDPASPFNQQVVDIIKGWTGVSQRVGYYSYTAFKAAFDGMFYPMTRILAEDAKYLKQLGVTDYLVQTSGSNTFGWVGLNYYIATKVLWNVDADVEALLQDYFVNLYGEEAGYKLLAAYNVMERSMRTSGVHLYGHRSHPEQVNMLKMYPLETLAQARRLVDEAKKLVRHDKQRTERIKYFDLNLLYTELYVGLLDKQQRFATSPDSALGQEMLNDITEMIRMIVLYGDSILFVWDDTKNANRLIQQKADIERVLKDLEGRRLEGSAATGGASVNIIAYKQFGDLIEKSGEMVRNSDETGKGDGKAGWGQIDFTISDYTKDYLVIMTVHRDSDAFNLRFDAGRTPWESYPPKKVTDQGNWVIKEFIIPRTALKPEGSVQSIGIGGGDSQIWLRQVEIKPLAD